MAAPFIMPDGSSLKSYLKSKAEKAEAQVQTSHRGKDAFWDLLVEFRSRVNSNTVQGQDELAEIRAMEKAGVRRRRRCSIPFVLPVVHLIHSSF